MVAVAAAIADGRVPGASSPAHVLTLNFRLWLWSAWFLFAYVSHRGYEFSIHVWTLYLPWLTTTSNQLMLVVRLYLTSILSSVPKLHHSLLGLLQLSLEYFISYQPVFNAAAQVIILDFITHLISLLGTLQTRCQLLFPRGWSCSVKSPFCFELSGQIWVYAPLLNMPFHSKTWLHDKRFHLCSKQGEQVLIELLQKKKNVTKKTGMLTKFWNSGKRK